MPSRARSLPSSPSASARRWALATALVVVVAVVLTVVLTRGGDSSGRSGSMSAAGNTGDRSKPGGDHGRRGAAEERVDSSKQSMDGRASGHDAAAKRDWRAGERKEAWERGFDAQGDGGSRETAGSFAAENANPGAKERRLEKRRERAENADAQGARSPDTVFQSEQDKEFETINQSEPQELEDLTGEGGTISFWVQPAWEGASQDDAAFVSIGDGQVRVYKNVNYLRFELTDADGRKASLGMPIENWSPGDWHQVTTTWDAQSHQIQLFLDEKLISQNSYDLALKLDKPKLSVGTNEPWMRPIAPGVVSKVEVRNQPMTPIGVSRRFYALQPRVAE